MAIMTWGHCNAVVISHRGFLWRFPPINKRVISLPAGLRWLAFESSFLSLTCTFATYTRSICFSSVTWASRCEQRFTFSAGHWAACSLSKQRPHSSPVYVIQMRCASCNCTASDAKNLPVDTQKKKTASSLTKPFETYNMYRNVEIWRYKCELHL